MSVSVLIWLIFTLGATCLLVMVCSWPRAWKYRRIIADAATAGYIVGGIFLWGDQSGFVFLITMTILQLFLVIVSTRLSIGRLHGMHLRHSTLASVAVLFGVSSLLMLLQAVSIGTYFAGNQFAGWVFIMLAFAWSVWVLWQITMSQKNFHLSPETKLPRNSHLPTVTLAIPARNETHVLADTLHAAVSSTYPKLEILVLDDCSQDRTSQLIRAFAHDGVRFIQGDEPTGSWLGKTKALQTLQEQASGEYIVFAGVDTLLSPYSIDRLIDHMLHNRLDMVSVLPQRPDGWRVSTLFQQLRYYWQVTLVAASSRAPHATSLWCIKSKTLKAFGGFNSVKNSIIPESIFARELLKSKRYQFIVSDIFLGVQTMKKWSSQNETALRVLYPSCRRQPVVVLLALTLLVGLIVPYLVALYGVISGEYPLMVVAGVLSSALLSVGYAAYLRSTSPRVWLSGFFTFPLIVAQEIGLLLASMLLYEFGEVSWKGRNVCYPVIQRPL